MFSNKVGLIIVIGISFLEFLVSKNVSKSTTKLPPICNNYFNDGNGRDGYISVNDGGGKRVNIFNIRFIMMPLIL